MFLLIEGELVQLEQIAHAYGKAEENKKAWTVYLHFSSGARTSFKYDSQDKAEALLIFIMRRIGLGTIEPFNKGGVGRNSLEVPADVTLNTEL